MWDRSPKDAARRDLTALSAAFGIYRHTSDRGCRPITVTTVLWEPLERFQPEICPIRLDSVAMANRRLADAIAQRGWIGDDFAQRIEVDAKIVGRWIGMDRLPHP